MNTKFDHEDAALQALLDELHARGRTAEIIAHPDRDPEHPLTVDALINIDGTQWAVDHCLLARPQQLPAAMAEAERVLQDELEAIAQASGLLIAASYLPQTGSRGERWGADYYARLIAMAREAAAAGRAFTAGDDAFTTIQTTLSATPGAVLVPFTDTTDSPFTGSQAEAGLRDALLKKLDGQLKQAKDAGFPTALLLDQIPRPGGNSHTVWIAGPTTVAAATMKILREHNARTAGNGAGPTVSNPETRVLDQVWLRPAVPGSPMVAPSVHLLIA